MVVSSFSCSGISTGDLNPVYNVPMLGTHKPRHPTAISRQIEFRLPSRRGCAQSFCNKTKNQSHMKSLIAALLLPLGIATIHAQSPLPPTVIVGGGGPVDSKEFTVWIEKDPTKYAGSFFGDVSGDTGGHLTITVTSQKDPALPFVASGTYKQKTAGSTPEQVVNFSNAHYYQDVEGMFDAGAFRMIFVKYGKHNGVIVNGRFIRKDP